MRVEAKTIAKSKRAVNLGMMTVGTALLIVASFFKIPFYPVSFTMHTAIIFFIGLTLPPKYALGSALGYLLLGTMGVPVFSGNVNTFWFLGRCGGFYLAFPLAALVIATCKEKMSFFSLYLLGQLIIYSLGIIWLLPFFPFHEALIKGVLVFIPSDTLKIFATYFMVKKWFAQ